jgi:NADH dehydrogenase FAD-containing subunit
VIVGAGLGGLAAPVVVTVVDARNYSTFAPLLFEAAVGVIVPEDVARPVRSFLGRRGHTTFRLGEVVAIDWGRHVELTTATSCRSSISSSRRESSRGMEPCRVPPRTRCR